MAKKQKTFRPKPRLPKGMRDIRANEISAMNNMLAKLKEIYELYGFEALETPAFEYSDCLGKFLPDQDRPNAGVFSFEEDEDGDWVSLRYDLTAPLARFVAANYDGLPKPFRRYQTGSVWRNEKPGPGRFRQFTQFDADSVGADSVAADAELAMLGADSLEHLGLKRGDYQITMNNRKILDGVLESAGINPSAEENELQRLTVLRAIDKLERLGQEGVQLLLGEGRKDESGDFTKGAGLEPKQIDQILAYLAASSDQRTDVLGNLESLVASSEIGQEGLKELRDIDDLLSAGGFKADRVRFDPTIVRGLDYYTGPVMEAELTFEHKNEDGQLVRFGSLGGGGRYDGLVARFKGTKVPATGFSIGVSRAYAALEALGKLEHEKLMSPVVVLVMDQENKGDYQAMVQNLRGAGVKSELYLGTSGMRAQLKYADKRAASLVVIQGEDERSEGKVTIKDMDAGAEMSKEIEDNKEWREARVAQKTVGNDELVATVKEMLEAREKALGNNEAG
ncbi:MAG: histidine--tRNA ligase [Methyloligella sp.]|nr:MAG: histidine--tRNA ligase [Methyloligella sp.]